MQLSMMPVGMQPTHVKQAPVTRFGRLADVQERETMKRCLENNPTQKNPAYQSVEELDRRVCLFYDLTREPILPAVLRPFRRWIDPLLREHEAGLDLRQLIDTIAEEQIRPRLRQASESSPLTQMMDVFVLYKFGSEQLAKDAVNSKRQPFLDKVWPSDASRTGEPIQYHLASGQDLKPLGSYVLQVVNLDPKKLSYYHNEIKPLLLSEES